MNINSLHLAIQKTARIYQLGEPGPQNQEIWIVLHGYGQLAKFFLYKFITLHSTYRYILAPEALSRYYLDPHYSRVGASWMTKEDRNTDIDDNMRYLDTLFQTHIQPHLLPHTKIILLGFSQGAATAWRWVRHSGIHFHAVILWAGNIPYEFTNLPPINQLFLVYGTEDTIVPPTKFQNLATDLRNNGLPLQLIAFKGDHTIDAKTLSELAAQLQKTNS
jgi:predicted esterase